MNKPIVLRTADIYLRFPEMMEEECNDLAEFLEDEHIVYEGATDVFIEKDKEIERLNNIINELEAMFDGDLDGFFTINEKGSCNEIIEVIQNYKEKLKELKEGR